MAPDWALIPLVVLATAATVIASQALISGAYSLTRQAVQLAYSPRVRIEQTSAAREGQIYIASVNWLLMAACIGLVIGFQESANLAAAYGLAVTMTMVITTTIFFVVAVQRFRWRLWFAVPLCGVFFLVDFAFFSATLFKIPDGGWFPLVAAAVVFTVLSTWRTGRLLVRDRLLRRPLPIRDFVAELTKHPPVRAPGSGAYLFRHPGTTPPALLATLRHHDSLHQTVLVVAIVTEKRPYVHPMQRAELEDLGAGFWTVVLHFGFMDDVDVPQALAQRVAPTVGCDLDTITYFLGRESLRVTARAGMVRWRERLFTVMSRNATSAAEYFRLPIEQTAEIGIGVEL
jgi:KUP system potassium uptake protein